MGKGTRAAAANPDPAGAAPGYTRAMLLDRITIETTAGGGRPCIRGLRIRVSDIVAWLASGASEAAILRDHPALEREDIHAARLYASMPSITSLNFG